MEWVQNNCGVLSAAKDVRASQAGLPETRSLKRSTRAEAISAEGGTALLIDMPGVRDVISSLSCASPVQRGCIRGVAPELWGTCSAVES